MGRQKQSKKQSKKQSMADEQTPLLSESSTSAAAPLNPNITPAGRQRDQQGLELVEKGSAVSAGCHGGDGGDGGDGGAKGQEENVVTKDLTATELRDGVELIDEVLKYVKTVQRELVKQKHGVFGSDIVTLISGFTGVILSCTIPPVGAWVCIGTACCALTTMAADKISNKVKNDNVKKEVQRVGATLKARMTDKNIENIVEGLLCSGKIITKIGYLGSEALARIADDVTNGANGAVNVMRAARNAHGFHIGGVACASAGVVLSLYKVINDGCHLNERNTMQQKLDEVTNKLESQKRQFQDQMLLHQSATIIQSQHRGRMLRRRRS